jgi:hypothetical protein
MRHLTADTDRLHYVCSSLQLRYIFMMAEMKIVGHWGEFTLFYWPYRRL